MDFDSRVFPAPRDRHESPQAGAGRTAFKPAATEEFFHHTRNAFLAAFLLFFLWAGASHSASQTPAIRFIAHRYDDAHVVFNLERTFPDEPELRRRSLTQNPTRLPDPAAKLAGMTLWKMDEGFWRRHLREFRGPVPGDRLLLKTGGLTTLHCTIEKLAVAETSCGTAVVAIAIVDAPELEAFRQVKQMHYLVLAEANGASAQSGPAGPAFLKEETLPGAGDKARLEESLREQLQRELPQVRRSSASSYALISRLEHQNPWPERDERLARGEGTLSYDLQALRLSPNGQRLYYVRAQWILDGETAFLMSAWIRPGSDMVLETVNSRPSLWLRRNEFQSEKLGLDDLGILLNVFDYDDDGWGEILIGQRAREGYRMHLLEYSEDQGFRRTGITYRYGC
jgi:hypothetical protein